MAERRCPNCGELVPSNSITCPKCYKKIPVEETTPRSRDDESDRKDRPRFKANRKVAILLNAILGLFGITGLGQLYCGQKRGALVLLVGLMFFCAAMALLVVIPMVSWILSVPFFILYAIVYLVSLADIVLGSAVIHFGTSR